MDAGRPTFSAAPKTRVSVPKRTSRPDSAGGVRLGTLMTIRWLSVGGQVFSLLLVSWGLGLPLPLAATLSAVAAAALLNLYLQLRHTPNTRLSERHAFLQLAFDLSQLWLLLYLTGGLANPFSVLMLVPATISASVLSQKTTYILSMLALALIGVLGLSPYPLPWSGPAFLLPPMLQTGISVALGFTLIFLTLYTARIARESRARARALAATQIALEREQRLAALGSFAAAAAHELGTPLGTILLAARDTLDHCGDLPSALQEDLELIVGEVTRCRDILADLASKGRGPDPFALQSAEAIVREAAAPHEGRGRCIVFDFAADTNVAMPRHAELIHGLRNIVENAVDHAHQCVDIRARVEAGHLYCLIQDDGTGFDPSVIRRLGEPYISRKPGGNTKTGMGLGLFIAATLLRRTGADIHFTNAPEGGALVTITWPLEALSAPDGVDQPQEGEPDSEEFLA